MKFKILISVVALLSLPMFSIATNYDVAIEKNAQQYMCLDSTTGAYFLKIGSLELAGHSTLYTYEGINGTVVQMYSQNMMCTGQYAVSKTKGTFTFHSWRDIDIKDSKVEDSGLCAVANKPPDIVYAYATLPQAVPTPDGGKKNGKNVYRFKVVGLLDDEPLRIPGLEWELQSNCFDTVKGMGNMFEQTFTMFEVYKFDCKFKLIVEDTQEGYAFAEFFVPQK